MTLLLTYHRHPFLANDPGRYLGQTPDGLTVMVTTFPCSSGHRHWVGVVENPDLCECDRNGTCRFCEFRNRNGRLMTRVTGCFRSSKSAINATQHWAANPTSAQPPSAFKCSWTTAQAYPNGAEPVAMPIPPSQGDDPSQHSVRIQELEGNIWQLTVTYPQHELAHLDGFTFTVEDGENPPDALYRQAGIGQDSGATNP